MSDNEKRAHDLAIFGLSKTIDFEAMAKEAAERGEAEARVDIYCEYKKMYGILLEALNRDFPEQ